MELNETDDDTLLSAYVDGELPVDVVAALEARLAQEPMLAARLSALRATNETARDAFSVLDEQPLPDSVTRLLETHEDHLPENVVAFPVSGIGRFLKVPVAIAASVALIAGFLLNDLLDAVPGDAGGPDLAVAGRVTPGTALFDVLETGSGGERMPLSQDSSAEVVLTFADSTGDFCRQIRVDAPERRANGVACRRGGGWQFEAVIYGEAQTRDTGFAPASDPSLAALDRIVDGLLGEGEILGSEEENRLISEAWKKLPE